METVRELIDQIKADRQANRLPLPKLPEVVVRVREVVADEESTIEDVARIIKSDPALVARMIQAANNACFAGLHSIHNSLDAVTRLGVETVRDLVTSLAVHSVFKTNSPLIRDRMKNLWKDSVRIAAISRVLATLGPDLDPERATMAGLVHDIGTIPLLTYLDDRPQLLFKEGALMTVLERLHTQMGSLVLQSWGFDEEMVRLPVEVLNYRRDPDMMPDYADVVMLARIFHSFGSPNMRYSGPPINTLPAFQKFPLGALGPEGGVELLEESRDEINTIIRLLQG